LDTRKVTITKRRSTRKKETKDAIKKILLKKRERRTNLADTNTKKKPVALQVNQATYKRKKITPKCTQTSRKFY